MIDEQHEQNTQSEHLLLLLTSNVHSLDPTVQKEIFNYFRNTMYRKIFFLLNDHALTEDVIQEAFIKAIKMAPKLKSTERIRAWLYRITRNTAYDLLRKNKKYKLFSNTEEVMNNSDYEIDSFSEIDKVVEVMVRNEVLYLAIDDLKYEYRVVILLYYIEELTYKEIMSELNISHDALMQRLSRGRKKLYEILIKKWGEIA